jgi:hypothetical protein
VPNDSSLGALGIPIADINVVQMRINKHVQVIKSQYRLDKSLVLHRNDEMTLSAVPHRLALLVDARGEKLVLAPKPRMQAAAELQKSHEMLTNLAQRLAKWLQSLVRIHIARRSRARRAHAALVIQFSFASFAVRRAIASDALVSTSFVRRFTPGAQRTNSSAMISSTPIISSVEAPSRAPWHAVKAKHGTQIRAAVAVNAQLKRVRQKRKPTKKDREERRAAKPGNPKAKIKASNMRCS